MNYQSSPKPKYKMSGKGAGRRNSSDSKVMSDRSGISEGMKDHINQVDMGAQGSAHHAMLLNTGSMSSRVM